MSNQLIKIVSLSDYIEEEVTISNGRSELTCFAANRPPLRIGDIVKVGLYFVLLSNQKAEPQGEESVEEIVRDGESYVYKVIGRLNDNLLTALGYDFEIGSLKNECSYLDGKNISLYIDRIGIDFFD